MTPQFTIDFNELSVTFVIKRGMLQARINVQVVFTVKPQYILAEFRLLNSMEPLKSLERPSKIGPMTDKPLTKKMIKNLKRNKH